MPARSCHKMGCLAYCQEGWNSRGREEGVPCKLSMVGVFEAICRWSTHGKYLMGHMSIIAWYGTEARLPLLSGRLNYTASSRPPVTPTFSLSLLHWSRTRQSWGGSHLVVSPCLWVARRAMPFFYMWLHHFLMSAPGKLPPFHSPAAFPLQRWLPASWRQLGGEFN